MDVSSLLERCRAGEALAVEALVRAYQAPVYRLAFALLDDPAEADEATQETFLAALKSLGAYRGQAAFTTWLYAVTVNVCRMRRRRWAVWRRLSETVSAVVRGESAPLLPEAAALQAERDEALWRAVQSLSAAQRAPIVLRYYHGCSVAEIAAVLGVPAGTIHSRLSIARDRLRAALTASPVFQAEEAAPGVSAQPDS